MRDFDEKGKMEGLFEEMRRLAIGVDPSRMPLADGFYVTDRDVVLKIRRTVIFKLTPDLDGQLCWVINMSYLDNWYEGPYFDMVPLTDAFVEEAGLRGLEERERWELKPEKAPDDDPFLKLRARVSGEDASYLDSLLDCARKEIDAWHRTHPDSKYEKNVTGTDVGELDALRRFGRVNVVSDWDYEDVSSYWVVAGQGDLPCTCSFLISLINNLDSGLVPELFLQESANRECRWDVDVVRAFLDFARRVYGCEISDLHHVELMPGEEKGPHSVTDFLRDLETGKTWRWTSEWTPYYSDGITTTCPHLDEP